MAQTYSEFDVVEQGDKEYIIAQPESSHEEPVRFAGDLKETDGLDASFRGIIKSIIQQDLSDALNLEEGTGGAIDRGDAIQTLAEAEEPPVPIRSQTQAEAIIDYLIENSVLQENGSGIVVLSDPESLADIAAESNDSEDTAMLLNWMSAIEGVTTKIEDTRDRVEEVEEDLREQMGKINATEKVGEYKRKREEVAQRIMNLTNGGQLEVEDLDTDERAEYNRLEHRLFHLDAMMESIEGGEIDNEIQKMTKELGMYFEELADTKTALQTQHNRLKQVYHLNEHINYEEAKQMAENLAKVASAVAGVANVDERQENDDGVSRAHAILEEMESSDIGQREEGEDDERADYEQGN